MFPYRYKNHLNQSVCIIKHSLLCIFECLSTLVNRLETQNSIFNRKEDESKKNALVYIKFCKQLNSVIGKCISHRISYWPVSGASEWVSVQNKTAPTTSISTTNSSNQNNNSNSQKKRPALRSFAFKFHCARFILLI